MTPPVQRDSHIEPQLLKDEFASLQCQNSNLILIREVEARVTFTSFPEKNES